MNISCSDNKNVYNKKTTLQVLSLYETLTASKLNDYSVPCLCWFPRLIGKSSRLRPLQTKEIKMVKNVEQIEDNRNALPSNFETILLL